MSQTAPETTVQEPYATHFMGMAPGQTQDGAFQLLTFVVPRNQVKDAR